MKQTVTMESMDWGQLIQGLISRVEHWEQSDELEASDMAKHYTKIIDDINQQLDGQLAPAEL